MSATTFVILAGGSEHRSASMPKSLLPVLGRAALDYALDLAASLRPSRTFVVAGSSDRDAIAAHAGGRAEVLEQSRPLGSGHAVGLALERVDGDELWVTYADRVLLRESALRRLVAARTPATVAALLSVYVQRPAGYARIVRDERGRVLRVTGDCELVHPDDAAIREVVAGAYWFSVPALRAALPPPATIDRKYNLTECVGAMIRAGGDAIAVPLDDPGQALGVYSPESARLAERALAVYR